MLNFLNWENSSKTNELVSEQSFKTLTKQEFKQLFDRYFDGIRNYIYYRSGDVDLATDLAQDVFLKLWEKQVDFNEKPNVGLLYKMASDEFISRYRRQQLEISYQKGLTFNLHEVTPENELEEKELQAEYEKALAGLSEKQRVVFLMSRMDGLKYSEIADRLNISMKAVEKRMKYALDDLRKKLLVS
ncbi:RNA polymerase sigma factor [Sunxiuqinia indica]|uniref:RNA polymerase sigma factor n=1 Tax=Sunxiuqinia indica TaxID=2692584 RepID=UPI001F242A21|nr:sigma-70 family RNA polymerase sigma factor [Sunxiuqinia indica]